MKTPASTRADDLGLRLRPLRRLVRTGRGAGRRNRRRTLARLNRQLPRLCASVQLHCYCSPQRQPQRQQPTPPGATWQQQPPIICVATVATHFGFRVATGRAGQADRAVCRTAVRLLRPQLERCLALADSPSSYSVTSEVAAAAAPTVCSVSTCPRVESAATVLRTLDLPELVMTGAASDAGEEEEEEADRQQLVMMELMSTRPTPLQLQQPRQRRQRRPQRRLMPTRRRLRLLPDASADAWDLPTPSTDCISTTSCPTEAAARRTLTTSDPVTSSVSTTDAANCTVSNVENEEQEDWGGCGSCSGDSAFFTCSGGRYHRPNPAGTTDDSSSSSSSGSGDGGDAGGVHDAPIYDQDDHDKDHYDKDCAAIAAVRSSRGDRRLRRRCLGLTRRLRAALLAAAPAALPVSGATRVRDLLGQALATMSQAAEAAAAAAATATAADCGVSVDTLSCVDLAVAAAAAAAATSGGDCSCGSTNDVDAAVHSKKLQQQQQQQLASRPQSRRHRRHRRWQLGLMKTAAATATDEGS